MEKKNSQMYNIDINNTKEIYDFCLLNKILDIDGFINKCFKNGFHIEKYGFIGGDSGKTLNDGEKDLKTGGIQEKRVEIEVIREIRVEVPVEVIKEVEKIVEVIKEVPVEKIIQVSDDTQINELLLKIQQLENRPPEIVEVIKEVITQSNNDKSLMLQDTLNKLRKELTEKNSKITELEGTIKKLEQININQGAAYMKGSNLTKNI
jgi:predicted RNase H-like nuclease (RuvC/YqgF family)